MLWKVFLEHDADATFLPFFFFVLFFYFILFLSHLEITSLQEEEGALLFIWCSIQMILSSPYATQE